MFKKTLMVLVIFGSFFLGGEWFTIRSGFCCWDSCGITIRMKQPVYSNEMGYHPRKLNLNLKITCLKFRKSFFKSPWLWVQNLIFGGESVLFDASDGKNTQMTPS